jgi:hypothetical protein
MESKLCRICHFGRSRTSELPDRIRSMLGSKDNKYEIILLPRWKKNNRIEAVEHILLFIVGRYSIIFFMKHLWVRAPAFRSIALWPISVLQQDS